MTNTHANYLLDLGYFIREAAEDAKRQVAAAAGGDRTFQYGRLMAYYEVVSLMQQQAVAFDLPLADLRLDGIEPDKDDAPAEIARPTPTSSSGTGRRRRWIATQAMEAAATMIRPPSTPAVKYSAFSVAVHVLGVRGQSRPAHDDQRDQSGGKVDDRLERIGEQPGRAGQPPGERLQGDRRETSRD